jgi:TRAP-type C4-dicarboxylate transport system permease small subunit
VSARRTRLDAVLETALFLALAAMVVIIFINVVGRYAFGSSLSWGEEVALLLMVWLTYLGAAVAMRDGTHYAVDFFMRYVPAGWRRTVVLGKDALVVLMTVLLLYWSAEATVLLREWVTPALEISQSWVYAACPVGSVFILFYACRQLARDLRP